MKDMRGFRSEMNLTIVDYDRSKNGSLNCAGEDEGENALLVRCEDLNIFSDLSAT